MSTWSLLTRTYLEDPRSPLPECSQMSIKVHKGP